MQQIATPFPSLTLEGFGLNATLPSQLLFSSDLGDIRPKPLRPLVLHQRAAGAEAPRRRRKSSVLIFLEKVLCRS